MAVTIEYRLSGGSANAVPADSIGGAMSSVAATGSTLFDAVGSAEAAAGDTEYRCIYVANIGTTTATSVKLWVNADSTQANITPALALDLGGVNSVPTAVANENTAPAGETFSTPTSEGTALSLGSLAQNDEYPVWVRRTTTAGATNTPSEGFTLRVSYEYA